MSYQTKASPITTEAEFDAARAAGARIEFTACGPGGIGLRGDTYDMPPCDQPDSGGWIPLRKWQPLEPGHLMRAFYPIPTTFAEAM